MIATLRDQSEFSELFIADLLSHNSRIEEDLIDQLFNSSEKPEVLPSEHDGHRLTLRLPIRLTARSSIQP